MPHDVGEHGLEDGLDDGVARAHGLDLGEVLGDELAPHRDALLHHLLLERRDLVGADAEAVGDDGDVLVTRGLDRARVLPSSLQRY